MRSQPGKLRLVGTQADLIPLTESELDELTARVRANERGAVVERVLLSLGIGSLPPDEQHVLRVITEGVAWGEPRKAVELARATGLSMNELERVCDSLLDKGLIGPAPAARRAR